MRIPYSLTTLWHDRSRFLPGVLAVAFSALLIALQCGLLLGLFSITSIPIDHTKADIWMGAPKVQSVDLGETIRLSYQSRLDRREEVVHSEQFLQGFSYWAKPQGGRELCMVIGSRLSEGSLGLVDKLTREHREALTEPNAIVIDESDKERLGIDKVGDTAEVSGVQVRVVGFTQGLPSLAGPYVLAHLPTAKQLLRMRPGQVTYILARVKEPSQAERVVRELNEEYEHEEVSFFTAREFSIRSQLHWLFKTKAGVALGYAALLGLLVGAVVTSQTLYAATAASMREFAVLRALGIPRWRIAGMVVAQAFWIGVIGVILGLAGVHGATALAGRLGANVLMPWYLQVGAAVITLTMAVLSGLYALRSLRLVEPAMLLR